MAAMIDAEGHISILKIKRKTGWGWSYRLQIGVTNTNKSLIFWMYRMFGGYVYDDRRSRKKNMHRRPVFHWVIGTTAGGKFLTKILPYLKLKVRQAKNGLMFQRSFDRKEGLCGINKMPYKVILRREKFRKQMIKLNRGKGICVAA